MLRAPGPGLTDAGGRLYRQPRSEDLQALLLAEHLVDLDEAAAPTRMRLYMRFLAEQSEDPGAPFVALRFLELCQGDAQTPAQAQALEALRLVGSGVDAVQLEQQEDIAAEQRSLAAQQEAWAAGRGLRAPEDPAALLEPQQGP